MRPHWLCLLLQVPSLVHATILVMTSNHTYADRAATFGPRLSGPGKLGFLIEPVDPTGCRVVEAPGPEWIALVRRGGCSFITKVRNMQESGAVAVAVGDPEHRSGWITMYAPGNTSDVTIPSVFLAHTEYNTLLYLSKFIDTPMMVLMQLDDFVTWPLIDIVMMIFISPSIMTFFIYISWKLRQRRKHLQEVASVDAVARLVTKVFSQEKMHENDREECAICLEEYSDGEELRVLPCRHDFHAYCVDAWLTTQKKLCPICKRDITFDHNGEVTPLLQTP